MPRSAKSRAEDHAVAAALRLQAEVAASGALTSSGDLTDADIDRLDAASADVRNAAAAAGVDIGDLFPGRR
ncbi:hypothetical protein [Streptomyces sp. NPDC088258]|uniref:hypothetical protein n=1 Tax=Streptomyces sp. NPDC088258 TaxID=3365849 RepID=UPI0038071BA4